MIEAGQFLDDARIYYTCADGSEAHYVFATFVEDSSQVRLEEGFFYQELDDHIATDCPFCSKRINIYPIATSITGNRVLCLYCEDCDLLFRGRFIGRLDNYGNFTAEENIK